MKATVSGREDAALARNALRLAGLGWWSWDARTDQFRLSEDACALFNLPLPGFCGTSAAFLQSVRLADVTVRRRSPRTKRPSTAAAPLRGPRLAYETLSEALQVCCQKPGTFDLHTRVDAEQGDPVWVRLSGEVHDADTELLRGAGGAVQDISSRKNTLTQYLALADRMTMTLESVTDGFFTVDRDWRFTALNPAAETLLGKTSSELEGKSLWGAFPRSEGSRFYQEYHRAMAECVTVEFEAYYPQQKRWLLVKAFPSPQGLAVYFQDFTQSRALKQALLDSEKRYRLLFEHSSDAILRADANGGVARANAAACRMFGMSEAQLCAAGREKLVAPGETRLQAGLDARRLNGSVVVQLTMVRADGSLFEAEASSSQYPAPDGTTVATTTLRDVTARLRKTEELRQLNVLLDERVRRRTALLEKANSELRTFSHSLAHDLRTPITTIGGFSGMLEKLLMKSGDERAIRLAGRIQVAAKQMGHYTDALLTMAGLSQVQLKIKNVDLSGLAREVFADLQEQSPLRAVAVNVQPGMRAKGDERLLRVVLENLLGNAWKFTSQRLDGEISFSPAASPEGAPCFCIQDNGAGFNPKYADRLFGTFQRLHTPEEFPGHGVGLANVQRVISRHDGRVWAESREGYGASFYFTLGLNPG